MAVEWMRMVVEWMTVKWMRVAVQWLMDNLVGEMRCIGCDLLLADYKGTDQPS